DGTDYIVKSTTTQVSKLKNIPQGLSLGGGVDIKGYSYKKGDLAVPAHTMPTLLGMLGLTVKKEEILLDTKSFAALKGEKTNTALPKFKAFHKELRGLQLLGKADSVDYSDVILGVGDEPGNKDFEAYDNV